MRKKFKLFKRKYAAAHHKKVRSLKRIGKKPLFTVPLATFMVLLLLVFVGFLVTGRGKDINQTRSNVVVVSYDKKDITIPTDAKNVGELLKRLDIKIKEGDVVEPSLTTEIASDNFRINVYRAVPVTVVDGGRKTFTYSAATTPRSIVKQTGLTVYPEDKLELLPTENFLAESSIGERVVITRSTPIALNLYGTQANIRTLSKTVGELLKERNIQIGKDDTVQPALETPLNPSTQVFLLRKGQKIQTIEQAVPMPVEYVSDSKLAYGQAVVRQSGAAGRRVITYRIEEKDGREIERKVIQEVVIQEPVKQIVARGSIQLTVSLQTWLYKLRMCETGGNYQRNSSNGLYFGAYQFRIDTWDSLARKVRPDLVGVRPDRASPADQDFMIIANTNRTSGLQTQNPGCYKKTGISNYPPPNH
jgi:resuscitation-promoting factor RpfB